MLPSNSRIGITLHWWVVMQHVAMLHIMSMPETESVHKTIDTDPIFTHIIA